MRDRPGPSEREVGETLPKLELQEISADDADAIREYLQFEIDQEFAELNPATTMERQVAYRQQQMKEGKLRVVAGREGNELIATSVVVLENGTMGKEIAPNEAYAAGTRVRDDKQDSGIGARASAEQDRIAREAGKTDIVTVISPTNGRSMRLRLKVGYRLEGVEERPATDERPAETNYAYRKDLTREVTAHPWKNEVAAGNLQLVNTVSADSPSELMIDPTNVTAVKQALAEGYRGVALLRPEDFDDPKPIEQNSIVFVRDVSHNNYDRG